MPLKLLEESQDVIKVNITVSTSTFYSISGFGYINSETLKS